MDELQQDGKLLGGDDGIVCLHVDVLQELTNTSNYGMHYFLLA